MEKAIPTLTVTIKVLHELINILILQKPIGWFTLQTNWLISMYWKQSSLMGYCLECSKLALKHQND